MKKHFPLQITAVCAIVHISDNWSSNAERKAGIGFVSGHVSVSRYSLLCVRDTLTIVYIIEEANIRGPCSSSFFGSHETSPIIWIGKPAPAIQC
jgi:hypothetical protein